MACGDHIMVKRWGGIYYHHGIDMGDGTVIHFSGEPFHRRNARVLRCSLEDFLKGGVKIVVQYDSAVDVLSASETTQRAVDLLEQTGYSLFRKNCEHFATYCKTGKPASEQVTFYMRAGAMVMLAGAALAGAAVGAKILGKGRAPRA